jgi:hypothetical protein
VRGAQQSRDVLGLPERELAFASGYLEYGRRTHGVGFAAGNSADFSR